MNIRRNRIVTRLGVVLATAVLATGFITTAANAANYDNASGVLRTPAGATSTIAMQCGRTGVLVLQTGAVAPQYFSYKATNSAGVTTGWMPWQRAYSLVRFTPITVPGYWVVEVQIAQAVVGGYSYDSEVAPVTVQPAGYNDRFWCKVTG